MFRRSKTFLLKAMPTQVFYVQKKGSPPQTVVTKISQETLAENARVPICHEQIPKLGFIHYAGGATNVLEDQTTYPVKQ